MLDNYWQEFALESDREMLRELYGLCDRETQYLLNFCSMSLVDLEEGVALVIGWYGPTDVAPLLSRLPQICQFLNGEVEILVNHPQAEKFFRTNTNYLRQFM